jgi:hypothetical protein
LVCLPLSGSQLANKPNSSMDKRFQTRILAQVILIDMYYRFPTFPNEIVNCFQAINLRISSY